MAVTVAVALVGHGLLSRLLRRIVRRDQATGLSAALEAAHGPSRAAVVPMALLVALPAAGLPPPLEESASRLAVIALMLTLGWTFVRMVAAGFDVALTVTARLEEANVDGRRRRTQLRMFKRLSVLTIGLVTAGFVLTAIPTVRAIGVSLFASAGVAGIVAGVAARPVAANLIAGLQIAIAQPIRIGDAVLVEGEWGHVEDITATYVAIEIWDQRRLIVPLAYFLEKPFQNWTHRTTELIQPILFYLDYSAPVERVRNQLEQIVRAHPLWDGRVWTLQVTELQETTMQLRALVSAASSGQAWDLRCAVREQLVEYLNQELPEALPRHRLTTARPQPGPPAGNGDGRLRPEPRRPDA